MSFVVSQICISPIYCQKEFEVHIESRRDRRVALYRPILYCMTDAEFAYLQIQLVYDQFARDHFNRHLPLEDKCSVKAIHVISIIHYKKFLLKIIITAEHSVKNDFDVYKLSAQLSAINKKNNVSIGDLEGRITKRRANFLRQRHEVNSFIEEHN